MAQAAGLLQHGESRAQHCGSDFHDLVRHQRRPRLLLLACLSDDDRLSAAHDGGDDGVLLAKHLDAFSRAQNEEAHSLGVAAAGCNLHHHWQLRRDRGANDASL